MARLSEQVRAERHAAAEKAASKTRGIAGGTKGCSRGNKSQVLHAHRERERETVARTGRQKREREGEERQTIGGGKEGAWELFPSLTVQHDRNRP